MHYKCLWGGWHCLILPTLRIDEFPLEKANNQTDIEGNLKPQSISTDDGDERMLGCMAYIDEWFNDLLEYRIHGIKTHRVTKTLTYTYN